MPRSAWAVEPREETGDGTESSAMLDRGSGPPGSRRYVIEGNTCLLRLYIARLIYHACFRISAPSASPATTFHSMIPRSCSRSEACSPTTYFSSATSCRIVSNSCPIGILLWVGRRDRLVRPEALDFGPLERPRPIGFANGDALAEPRYHVARQPFQRLLILLLLACRFDQVTTFGVLQQPPGDLLRGNEALLLPIRLLDDAGDDREDISLFPRRFHSCVTRRERPSSADQPAESKHRLTETGGGPGPLQRRVRRRHASLEHFR